MQRMWSAAKAFWRAINAVSTAAWLWGLPWAAAAGLVTSTLAHFEHLPAVVIWLVALAAAVIVYFAYVLVRVHRAATPVHAYDTEPRESVGVTDQVEAEVIPAPVAATEHAPPLFEQLLKDRERLKDELSQKELEFVGITDALVRYQISVERFRAEKIIRPLYHDPPETTMRGVVEAFRRAAFNLSKWQPELETPKAVYSEFRDPSSVNSYPRQMFDPADNERYLGKHRQNLVIFEEAVDDARKQLDSLREQITRLIHQIQAEACK